MACTPCMSTRALAVRPDDLLATVTVKLQKPQLCRTVEFPVLPKHGGHDDGD